MYLAEDEEEEDQRCLRFSFFIMMRNFGDALDYSSIDCRRKLFKLPHPLIYFTKSEQSLDLFSSFVGSGRNYDL